MSVGVSITAANAAAIETPTLLPLESVDCFSINSQSAVLELEQRQPPLRVCGTEDSKARPFLCNA